LNAEEKATLERSAAEVRETTAALKL